MNDASSAPNAHPFHDIDETLSQWRQKLEAATTNLLDLSESPIRKHLSRRDLAPALGGQTGPQVEAALSAISEIFQGFARLSDVIERARDLRRAPAWPWQTEERRREIHHLLFEESIETGFDATPLAQRGLLCAPGQTRRVTPDELMQAMATEFEVARDILERVECAWSELPLELSGLETQIAPFVASNSGVDAAFAAEIAAIASQIKTLREMLMVDPLGAVEAWPKLQARGEAMRTRIEAASRRAREIGASLSRAEATLSELNALHARAEDAWAEAQLAVQLGAAPAKMPLSAAQIADLAAWLETLQATVSSGRDEAARVGLTRWHEAAAGALEHEKLALETPRALLRRRDELRGLLNALSAKSRALVARGVKLDENLVSAAREAHSLLKARPMSLERVAELVAQFEAGLAAASRR